MQYGAQQYLHNYLENNEMLPGYVFLMIRSKNILKWRRAQGTTET